MPPALSFSIFLFLDSSASHSIPGRAVQAGVTSPLHIPEVFPGLLLFPQKYLALNEPAIPVERRNLLHLFIGQQILNHSTILLRMFCLFAEKGMGVCPR